MTTNKVDAKERTAATNSGLAKGGLTCFVEIFVQGSAFVLRMKLGGKNPALRQAANRYRQFKD
ncbi:MAG: hypothetical protein D8M52_08760 [Chlorobi bacterium]|nr:hypothetical protein [Chlorobiota bacterium]NOG68262.1 hypothetical protein [Chlorobiota bacterium]QOJ25881.1 MAG: hypothetical protein HRU79_04135 [Ignavibacteria bacterium]